MLQKLNIESQSAARVSPGSPGSHWTFLSSHGQVLLSLSRDPDKRMREVASDLGLTERAVQRIVSDLETEGYLTRVRVGRRNHYEIHTERPMRSPIVAHREVRNLLSLLEKHPPASF
jgi:predicted transcriptional regulator